MFLQKEGAATGLARVFSNEDPWGGQRPTGDWECSLVAADSYTRYTKSWFDRRWEKLLPGAVPEPFLLSFLTMTGNQAFELRTIVGE